MRALSFARGGGSWTAGRNARWGRGARRERTPGRRPAALARSARPGVGKPGRRYRLRAGAAGGERAAGKQGAFPPGAPLFAPAWGRASDHRDPRPSRRASAAGSRGGGQGGAPARVKFPWAGRVPVPGELQRGVRHATPRRGNRPERGRPEANAAPCGPQFPAGVPQPCCHPCAAELNSGRKLARGGNQEPPDWSSFR